ncbi:MAG: hypothetical protein KGZ60_10095 [Truepera sp.]|nr:hypothetical protein [Truepera sp.]
MIKNLRLKFGKGPGSVAEQISTTPVTVFVGPNNSGKSKVLSEIHRFCTSGQKNTTDVIVDEIEFNVFTEAVADDKIKRVTLKPHAAESVLPDHVLSSQKYRRHSVP